MSDRVHISGASALQSSVAFEPARKLEEEQRCHQETAPTTERATIKSFEISSTEPAGELNEALSGQEDGQDTGRELTDRCF